VNGRYILVGQTAVPCEELMEWAEWFETADRRVFETFVGAYRVSTVFLGLDHSFGHGPPVLFETMIFLNTPEMERRPGEDLMEYARRTGEASEGDELHNYQTRAETWLEAETEHEIAVVMVEEKTGKKREAAGVTL
jgi:hypothetical protein